MTQRQFWTGLIVTTVITLALIFGLHMLIPSLKSYQSLSILSFIAFILFCILAYYIGLSSAQSENKYAFSRFSLLVIMLKMLICLLIIFGYYKLGNPVDKFFVIPFLVIYLTYTIFEVYFLNKLARFGPSIAKNDAKWMMNFTGWLLIRRIRWM